MDCQVIDILPGLKARGFPGEQCCQLIEVGGEDDHVYLLLEIRPAFNISTMINNLKSASPKRVRNNLPKHTALFYWKPNFWNRAYFMSSVGNVPPETIRRYVVQQGTKEMPRKTKPTVPHLLVYA